VSKLSRRKSVNLSPPTEPSATGRRGERRWIAPLCLFVLSLLYFHHFILSDDILLGIDSGTDFHRGQESALEKIAELDQSMWNPRLGGYPESEDLRWRYFPTYAIYLTTSWHRHIGWRYILTVFVAGLGMFHYLRHGLRVGWWASLWAGVAFMSAPTFMSFIFAGHFAKMGVIALFPYMCLLLERGMGPGGRPAHFAGLAALIGLAVYTPHLQMLYYALWGIGFYFLFKLYLLSKTGSEHRLLLRRSLFFIAAVILGLGLGSEGLWPSYFYSKGESKRAGGETGKTPQQQLDFARSWSLHPEEVGSLILPQWGGFTDPKSGVNYYWGRNAMKLNSEYFGIGVILLALIAIIHIRQRSGLSAADDDLDGVPSNRTQHHVIFMIFLFLFALTYALGPHTPVHWIMYHLVPGANVLRTPGMIAYLFAFPACVLAAIGLDQLSPDLGHPAALARRILQVGGALTGIALIVTLAPAASSHVWQAILYSGITPDKQQVFSTGLDWLQRGALYSTLIIAGSTVLLYLGARQQVSLSVVAILLCALTVADTWRINSLFFKYENPKRSPDMRRENAGTVAFLKGDAGSQPRRILPLPNSNLLKSPGYRLFGIPSVSGFHDFTIRRYDRLLREIDPVAAALGYKLQAPDQVPYSQADLAAAMHPLLNLLAARYIVTPRGFTLTLPAFPEVFTGERLQVYENGQATPWLYAVPGVTVMSGEAQIVSSLKSGAIDLHRQVILERPPPPGLSVAEIGSTSAASGPAAIELQRNDIAGGVVSLSVDSPEPRMLVMAENFHSNWKAFVDGVESEIYRANYIWQAVHVPAGRHEVEFRYRSRTVVISRWMSLLSAVIIIAICAVEVAWRGRRGVGATPVATAGA